MKSALKFEQAVRRIEMMLSEIKVIEIDAHAIIEETEEFHKQHFSEFDILDNDIRLAERSASDRVIHARTLRSAASQLTSTLESEINRLRSNSPFA